MLANSKNSFNSKNPEFTSEANENLKMRQNLFMKIYPQYIRILTTALERIFLTNIFVLSIRGSVIVLYCIPSPEQ
jgi:hypothetical protein